jgi:quinol-cytochrome oxidoreductase complex cytochrome b subunit
MIVLLEPGCTQEVARAVAARLTDLGLQVTPLEGPRGRALEVDGPDVGRALALLGAPGVRAVLSRRTPLEGGEPLWPHVALRVALLSLSLLLVLLALVVIWPPGLGDEAHPDTVLQAQPPEWYLRPAAVALDLAGEAGRRVAGVALAGAWLLLLLWPFVDRADVGTPRGRAAARVVRLGGALLLLAWVALAAGVVS